MPPPPSKKQSEKGSQIPETLQLTLVKHFLFTWKNDDDGPLDSFDNPNPNDRYEVIKLVTGPQK